MYKDVLRSAEGIEIYPSISLILFFVFFILMIVYLVRTGKGRWEHAANLPLESDKTTNLKFEES